MKKQILMIMMLCVSSFGLQGLMAQKKTTEKVTFFVDMHCESCQKKVEKNISFEKGVKDLIVNLKDKHVTVTYDTRKTNEEALKAGFKKIGYDVKVVLPDTIKKQ